MSTTTLLSSFEALPPHLRERVAQYVEQLLREAGIPAETASATRAAAYGNARGTVSLRADSDDSMADFADHS